MADGSLPVSDADVRQRLLDEVGKTELGRYLLKYLADRDIEIVASRDLSKANAEGRTAAAYWNPAEKKIVIDPSADMPVLLHFFAHETRHAGQTEANLKLGHQIEKLHPFHAILNLRLQEMDADVFAVYFVANHVLKVKPQEGEDNAFTVLSRPAPPPKTIERGNQIITFYNIDRSGMYRDFEETWFDEENKGADKKNVVKSLHSAAGDFLRNERITKYYAQNMLKGWQDGILPLLNKFKDKPQSDFAKAFRDATRGLKNRKWDKPEVILKNTLEAYGKIFGEGDAPDYSQGVNFERLAKMMIEDTPGANAVWQLPGYEDSVDTFNQAGDYYLKKAEKPAKPRAKTP